ncbi:SDR family NAD(P)-dependent oxidoreductase [Lacipirellula limnantheis]|uniref:Ketoacyl reductase n=1 Tax=Lacipirellula limnantheis TaxID=2528024 RepID=A0A517U3E0_9BACT|nr:SDR family oxidoreductase [Lacipirellula limnantheis]QDT75137.1 Putative ketoacyl reductase [Lacipirellula limnantheis]
MRQIRGKTALVTGAASGIGRAIALRLAEEGARLYLLDVNPVALASAVGEAKARGVDVVGRHCDLSQPAQISAAVGHLLDQWGGVDVLVNNAGITYYGRTHKMAAEHWDQLLAINLQAPIQLIRELLPTLLSRDEAHILNVASICGLVGMSRVAAYTTSKFALVGLSETLRAEYSRQGIGVTALCPGLVDTNLFAAAPRGTDINENKQPPRWLLATPETIANRAVRAIYKNHGIVVVQPYARLTYLVKRWAPGLLDLGNRLRRRKQGPDKHRVAKPEEKRRAA